jgi:hypothetical protein
VSEGISDEAAKWRRLLALTREDQSDWLPGDLGQIWRHQLGAPLEVELAEGFRKWAQSNDQGTAPRTFEDLLGHPAPPLELLRLVKNLAKERRAKPTFPSEIATALYYAAIAIAWARYEQRITELDDAALCRGLEWTIGLSWLDESTRIALKTALSRLSGG